MAVDATGLKVYGADEWLIEKHGERGTRAWRNLHLAVDALYSMIAHNKRAVRTGIRMPSALSGRDHRNLVCVRLSYRTFSQPWAFHPY